MAEKKKSGGAKKPVKSAKSGASKSSAKTAGKKYQSEPTRSRTAHAGRTAPGAERSAGTGKTTKTTKTAAAAKGTGSAKKRTDFTGASKRKTADPKKKVTVTSLGWSKVKTVTVCVVAALVLAYVGWEIYYSYYANIDYEKALTVTVLDTIEATGIAVRDESVVTTEQTGVLVSTVHNGGKVSKGETVANIFRSSDAAQAYLRLQEIDEEIAQFESMSTAAEESAGGIASIEKQLGERMVSLSRNVMGGDISSACATSDDILYLLNKNQIATKVTDGFDNRINELKAERDQLAAQYTAQPTGLTSPRSGYYINSVDGYETLLSTDMLPTLTPEMLDDVRQRWSEPVNAWTVGKIADDYIWNIVCELPAKEAERFTIGKKYTLHLPWSDVESVDAHLRYINIGTDEERMLLVFECSYMVSELAAVREQPITIELARYTGMQLSESAFTRNICTVSVPEDTIASDSDIVEIVPEEKKEEEAGNTTAATTAPTTAPTTVPTTASTQPADTAQPDDTAASAETNAGEGSAEQQPEQPKKPKMVKVRKWCDGVYIVWGNEVIFKRVEVIYRKDGKMICTTKAGDNSWIKLYDQVATDTRGLYDGKIFGGTV
ncbi:MAG: hypothetical protein E7559_00525 [Ruminococcaceae bacterium]|nr:hypothetical protein [Oscillospiraceae bacterium]